MSTRLWAVVALITVPVGTQAEEPRKDKGETVETRVAAPQSREVIERLKTMRAQLLLDQEYNRLLEARVKRMELEEKLGVEGAELKGGKRRADDLPRPPPRSISAPPAALDVSGPRDLVVKSVTVAPFRKLAIIPDL